MKKSNVKGNSRSMTKIPKKQAQRLALVNEAKFYTLGDAIKSFKSMPQRNFDESVNIAINLGGIDPKQSGHNIRSVVALPHGNGKTVRVAVFAVGPKAQEAEKAGADFVGGEDLIEQIKNGKNDFDKCIATPDMMAKLSAIAKILGPSGKMPNPKLGTVTMDVAGAIKATKAGQIEFRAEKAGIVHGGIGKVSFDTQKLVENIQAFFGAVEKAKPSGVKGNYIKSIFLSLSMGPSVKIDLSSIFKSDVEN